MSDRRGRLPVSPCVGVCALDPGTGWCRGCARTGDEIGRWAGADPAWRAAVWARLPARARRLGIEVVPPPGGAGDNRSDA
ncbi:hypothetical protein CCR85_02895 [Rhodothalassium salexigens]|uniref:DUF1289 domain-containing protein n=1 Tax=Rhodothalassium salexigens TaxID=1086 RepID=UPI001912B6ED|nr:DUF1289 domain-containing protein [Rhodothalassium salexigens]MBK5910438.1 hypothetical protein [Rhodothalassium salexigens]MBK5921744.1 hypothetical protein [Rhodothalassium salexigens]